jgi:hypothetical protein
LDGVVDDVSTRRVRTFVELEKENKDADAIKV